jgi:fatty-acyl-CoA synthase
MAFALRPATWLDRMTRHRVTCTGGPNFAFGLLAQLLEAGAPADLSEVRHMFCGGEPIDAALMDRFAAAAAPRGLHPGAVVAAYGLAESTLAVSFSPLGAGIVADGVDPGALERDGTASPARDRAGARRLVRLGPAVPGTRIRIVDAAESVAAPRTVGHIEVCGPSVVAGYWGMPRREGDWLRTGDLGYLDDDGGLVVCGRTKDVLFAAGRNIYPQDVEAAALSVPGVRLTGAAAFGIPSEHGDRLVVAVETRAVQGEELRKAVALAVAAQVGLAPAEVVALRFGRLPKTSSGKLRRAEIRRRYLAGELTEHRPTLVDRSVR